MRSQASSMRAYTPTVFLAKMRTVLSRHERLAVSLALALVVILSYGNVVFMGSTLLPSGYVAGVTPTGPYGYSGRKIGTLPTIDPAAVGTQNHPLHMLVIQYLLSGRMPLWNPYQATGIPLAADTVMSAYAPLNMLHFLPSELWDVPILLRLWIAGLFTHVFLRNQKLSKESSFIGAVLYMLSGTFTWYVPMDHLNILMLTPLLLFCVDRLVKRMKVADVCLTGLAVMLSLLGGHIESIILQFILVILYFIFRVTGSNVKIVIWHTFRLAASFALGFGLSAFFILPIFEYLVNSFLGHGSGTGVVALLPHSAITTFIPYFFGQVQSYIAPSVRQVIGWDSMGGYIGVCALFLSLVAVMPDRSTSRSNQRFALFFFTISILALLKTYGVPPVQWVAYLPVFDHMAFPRYLGLYWCFGFSISAAVGFEKLGGNGVRKQLLLICGMAAFVILAVLAWVSVPFPLVPGSIPFFYSGLKLVEGLVFLCTITLLSIKLKDSKKFALPLIAVVVLEMVFYTPQGMSYVWELYRSLLVLSALALTMFVAGRKVVTSEVSIDAKQKSRVRISTRNILLSIILLSLIMQSVVAGFSPQGLPHRNDAFKQAPYILYLQANAGVSRIYTFDNVLPPTYAGVFGLYQIGTYTAFNVASFRRFAVANLDRGIWATVLASNEFLREPNTPGPVIELHRNAEFYSLLGVKYIVTNTTDLNYLPDVLGGDSAIPIDGPQITLEQSFVSMTSNLSSIAIQLGRYEQKNYGSLVLTLDSVPPREEYHRMVALPAERVCNLSPPTIFEFSPILNALGKQFRFTLQFPQATSANAVAVFSYSGQHPYTPIVRELTKGSFRVNGRLSDGILTFALSSYRFKQVYSDGIAKIFENQDVFPRAFIVHRFRTVQSLGEAQDDLRNPDFDLRKEIILNLELPENQEISMKQAPATDNSKAEILQYEPDKVAVRAYAEHPGLLVLTDIYYPGWKANIDGKPVSIYQANGLVRAVYLDVGEHVVEFIYSPESFQAGAIITIFSFIALLSLVFWDKTRNHKEKKLHRVHLIQHT